MSEREWERERERGGEKNGVVEEMATLHSIQRAVSRCLHSTVPHCTCATRSSIRAMSGTCTLPPSCLISNTTIHGTICETPSPSDGRGMHTFVTPYNEVTCVAHAARLSFSAISIEYRERTNMAHIRQSRPGSGLDSGLDHLP